MIKIRKKQLTQIQIGQIQWQQRKKNQSATQIDYLKNNHRIKPQARIPVKYLNYFHHKTKLITQPNDKELPAIPFLKNSAQIKKKLSDLQFDNKFQPINKNAMLLNQMIGILKNGQASINKTEFYRNRSNRMATQGSYQNFNEFIQKDIKRNLKSSKNARPVIIQNQMTKISNFENVMIRNLKSEQKSRKKVYILQKKPSQNSLSKDKQSVQLLTFYNNKSNKNNINFNSPWLIKRNINLGNMQQSSNSNEQKNQFI